jgi:SAM-dependent methyltransferase
LATPVLGAPQQFEALRGFLKQVNYSEAAIRERLGVPAAEPLEIIGMPHTAAEKLHSNDTLDQILKLFLFGIDISGADAQSKFPPPVWNAMTDLGIVEEDPAKPGHFCPSVALYPLRNIFIASDHWSNPDGSERKSFPDIVYPAITPNSRELFGWLPLEPCDAFLELCGGTGAAAIMAAPIARSACSADVTSRSALFARFNGALNGATNFVSLQGDLYEAVRGQTFDRISAHPPYVPVLQPRDIYFGGGEDGEEITRRIIQGLPDYLRPGGRLYCRALGSDRDSAPFEKRVREWLGERQSEFDVALFVKTNIEPVRFASESAIKSGGGGRELDEWKALFGRQHIRDLLLGLVLIQRVNSPRPVFTIRRKLGEQRGRELIEWLMNWEERMRRDGALQMLLASKPRPSPNLSLNIRHEIESGEWVPHEITLVTPFPFPLDTRLQPWMCSMICRCDGKHTVSELHSACREDGWIREDTPPEEFARLAGALISGGFLEIDEATLPAAAK